MPLRAGRIPAYRQIKEYKANVPPTSTEGGWCLLHIMHRPIALSVLSCRSEACEHSELLCNPLQTMFQLTLAIVICHKDYEHIFDY